MVREVDDDYLDKVIREGDEGSDYLRGRTAVTLRNSEHVMIMGEEGSELPVVKIPDGYFGVVHSTAGEGSTLGGKARFLVDDLREQASVIKATPVGFVDIIDSESGDRLVLEEIANSLVDEANEHKIAILNGENAILGSRVREVANVSGTMISIVPKSSGLKEGLLEVEGVKYIIFDPKGEYIHINCDGQGTKAEFFERLGNWNGAVKDFLAMVLDDKAKLGAKTVAVSGVIEGSVHNHLGGHAQSFIEGVCREYGFSGTLQSVNNHCMRSYKEGVDAFNIGGSVVSLIDENRLRNLPKPNEGDEVMALVGIPNPRSNGITDKRKAMVRLFGNDWHETIEGKMFLEYLARPSTVLAPLFDYLLDEGIATSVYHMSGGAYNGKFARPLAKHGLFASLECLFNPDWRELTLAGADFTSAEVAYAKCPMGNDGFVTTADPNLVSFNAKRYDLLARRVGKIEKRADGRTGVELVAYNGKTVSYSGKAA